MKYLPATTIEVPIKASMLPPNLGSMAPIILEAKRHNIVAMPSTRAPWNAGTYNQSNWVQFETFSNQ